MNAESNSLKVDAMQKQNTYRLATQDRSYAYTSFIRRVYYFILVLNFLFLADSLHSQNSDLAYKKMVKRYGNATPWANGYIIKVNSFYGFANKSGKLVIPICNIRFDTLLPDRANVSYSWWGSALVDGNGQTVAHGDGLYYYLINRKSRLFAIRLKDNKEQFFTEKSGVLFGMTYDARTPKDHLLGNYIYDGSSYSYGIMNFRGDTILPFRYKATGYSTEPGLYCGISNDTAYVFSNDRKFLFSKHSVQNCMGINKDFISLGKYGMYALVNRAGRMVTGFHYTYIEPITFADSIAQQADETHLQKLATASDYFITHRANSRGLIDSSGKELLPTVYESIRMASNGWLILRKSSHGREELVNNRFEKVLETEAEGISFINKRYVSVETQRNTGQQHRKIYDMVLNRFVEQSPIKRKTAPEHKKENTYHYFNATWRKDSVLINDAGNLLHLKNGRWGVCSFTGDTILPFIYDTAFQQGAFYVGRNGKYAALNWEGDLMYPLEISELPQYWSVADSQLVLQNKSIYSYKGWRLQKVETGDNHFKDPYLQFISGIAYAYGNTAAKPGLYNRRMKKLGDKPYRHASYPMIRSTGIVAIEDSIKGLVAVVDSTGRQLIPWIKEPRYFMVRDHYALAINDTGKPDILYRFEKGITYTDEVWLDAGSKPYIINDLERYYGPDDSRPLKFEKRGYGIGVLNTKPVILIKGTEVVDMTYEVIRIKIGGKWGLYDYDRKLLVPHEYDSIDPTGYFFRLLVKNGKTGFFHIHDKHLIAPIYDSVCYQSSYVMNYFIGYKHGLADVVNTNGKTISTGWQNMKPLCRYAMEDLAGNRHGKRYALYPTLSDSLEMLPFKEPAGDLEFVAQYSDGNALVSKDGKLGSYNSSGKQVHIPAEYSSIERVEDYFFAKTDKPQSLTLYSPDGVKMFSLSGTYYDPILLHQCQWQLWGSKGYLVVNSKGKTIVPPGYKSIMALNAPGPLLYLVEAENGKHGLIDTSGKIIVQNLYDDISDEAMYNGFRSVTLKGKKGLLSPAGKLLAPCAYASVTSGKPKYLDEQKDCTPEQNKKSEDPLFIVSLQLQEKLKYGLLDKTGALLIPCVYDYIQEVAEEKTMIVNKGAYMGLVNINNKALTAINYDYILPFTCGRAQFRRGDLKGYLSPDGRETLTK